MKKLSFLKSSLEGRTVSYAKSLFENKKVTDNSYRNFFVFTLLKGLSIPFWSNFVQLQDLEFSEDNNSISISYLTWGEVPEPIKK